MGACAVGWPAYDAGMESKLEDLDLFLDILERLGPMERKVLLIYAQRLGAGQRKYGLLEAGKKDWNWEALEETLDQSVYITCELVKVIKNIKERTELTPELND